MKYTLKSIALCAILFSASCGSPDQADIVAESQEETLEEIKNLKLKAADILIALGNPEDKTWNEMDASDLVHHNPWMKEGVEGLKSKIKDRQYFAARLLQDGNYVFAHAEEKRGDRMYVRMDVMRFSHGKLQELWSGINPQLSDIKTSGRKQMGGKLISSEQHKTASNKAFVTEYVKSVLIGRSYEHIPDFFSGDTLIQHNPRIEDGLTAWRTAVHEQKPNGNSIDHTELVHILAEGNFVLAVCNGNSGGERTRFFDLFRIQDGKIAEHWDVIHLLNEKLK